MKKLLLGIALSFYFGACSTESNNAPPSENNLLISNWTYSHKYQNENYIAPSLCEDENILIFSSDQSWLGEYYAKNDSGNCYKDEEEFGSWQRQGAQLIMTYEDSGEVYDSDTYEILKLTDSELELKLEFDSGNYHIYVYKQ